MLRFLLQALAQNEQHGISQETVATLMRNARTPSQQEMEGGAQCPICLEAYEASSRLIDLECNHTFHSRCIMEWFRENSTCPVCRHSSNDESADGENVSIEILPQFVINPIEQRYVATIVFPNGFRQTTLWTGSNTPIDICRFVQHTCSQPNANIQLSLGTRTFKTSESYHALNVNLATLRLPGRFEIGVSFF